MKLLKLCICLILGISIISYSSCCKDAGILVAPLEGNRLIFGHYFGECLGETCIETFALTDDKLYEDTDDIYNATDFNFIELGNDKFELAKDLVDIFPSQLLSETQTTFGCPDCDDGGGYYVRFTKNGVSQSWRINKYSPETPQYLRDFVQAIADRITLIND